MDILVLYLLPVISSIIIILFRFPSIIAYIFFLLIPSIYLSFKSPKKILKTATYSLLFSIPITLGLDYLMQSLNVWRVTTIFNFRAFGVVPIEQFVWGFLYYYLIIIYYETFIDKNKETKFKIKNKSLFIIALFWIFFSLTIPIVLFHNGIIVPYMYLLLGIIGFIIPIVYFLIKFPKLLKKLSKTILYTFTIAVFFEFTEVYLKDWTFPGNYIGWISVYAVRFPIEELIFYMFISSVGLLVYYEIFADDLK